MSALLARRRIKNVLLFLPNLVLLCGRLLKDSRVPATEKALLAGAIVYAFIPFDLIPDMIPFVGQIDDTYLIALTLIRLMDRTEPGVIREHWNGGGDVVELVRSSAMLAARFLPKSIRRVLTSKVETAPGKLADMRSRPLLVEEPEPELPADVNH